MEIASVPSIPVRFLTEDGSELGTPLVLPVSTNTEQLQLLCNQLLERTEDPIPISFRTDDDVEIVESIRDSVGGDKLNIEKVYYYLLKISNF